MGNHIIIGLGGRGGDCLKSFRKILYRNSLTVENAENHPIECIYVDSSEVDLQKGWNDELGINYSIKDWAKVNIRTDNSFADIIDNLSNYPNISPWIGDKTKWAKLTINASEGAGQARRLGRVYFAANLINNKDNSFYSVLKKARESVVSKSGDASKTTYHILAGLSGGTGSGTIIDTISLVSKFLKDNSFNNDRIIVYTVLPERNETKKDVIGFYYSNTYAAFSEINAIGLQSEREKNPLKYNPFDISEKSFNIQKINENRINATFDSCFLFSNENENNKIIDYDKALPDLVGDFLYHSIINLPLNKEGQNAYEKLTENTLIEAEIDKFSGAKERAIKFASASIKRIEIPEIEVIDYYGAKLAMQFVLQQNFNNWINEIGYDNNHGEDQTSDFVFNKSRADNFMAECGITIDYLSLKTPHDADYQKTDDLWDTNSKILYENSLNVYTNGEEKLPIIYFNKYMEAFFNSQFRGAGIGVEKYWKLKTDDLQQQSKFFYDRIEKKLLDYWVSNNGRVVGLDEISKIINKLIEELNNISSRAANRIKHLQSPEDFNPVDADYTISGCNREIGKLIKEFGQLIKFRSSKTIVADAAQFITKLYKNKTDIIAYEFAIKNIVEINKNLENLSMQINVIKNNIYNCLNFLNEIITEKRRVFENRKDGKSHLSANVEMLFKEESIEKDFKIILKQKTIIQRILADFRRTIANSIDKPTFESLSELLTEDKIKTNYLYYLNSQIPLLYRELEQENLIKSNEKLVGRNVLDYFRKEYTDDKLREYFNQIKNKTGVFAKLSNTTSDTLDDVDNKTYGKDQYIIQIPSYKEDDSAEKYEEKFLKIIREIFGNESQIVLNNSGKGINEITIFKAKKQMALRSFDMVSGILHEKYKNSISKTSNWAELILHTEGTNKDYPKIIPFKDTEKEKAWEEIFDEELLPYLLIGLQTNHIQKNKNNEYTLYEDPNSITTTTTIISEKKSTFYEIKDFIFKSDILELKTIEHRLRKKIFDIIGNFIVQKENKKNYLNWMNNIESNILKEILEIDYEGINSHVEFQKIIKAFEKIKSILHIHQ